jgi:hypothetical protein
MLMEFESEGLAVKAGLMKKGSRKMDSGGRCFWLKPETLRIGQNRPANERQRLGSWWRCLGLMACTRLQSRLGVENAIRPGLAGARRSCRIQGKLVRNKTIVVDDGFWDEVS